MSPVVLGAVGAVLVMAFAVALVRTRAARTARLSDLAQASLRDLRAWKSMVEAGLARAVTDSRWIARDVRHEWDAQRPTPSVSVLKLARRKEAGAEARELIAFVSQDLSDVTKSTNNQILRDELRNQRAFFDTIETKPLTDEQATAVATFDNRVQVIAAAGSGKTSVMVARAAYAIRRELVPADRILLLAFNKDAAAELQQRIDDRLDAAGIDSAGLRASTFHAFGLNVIGKATGRKQRLASWIDGGQDVAMVSRIVDDLRDRSPDFRFKWDMYRLLFARMADDPAGGEPDAYDYATRATGFRTFNGETVKSQGERMIADFLFLNGVKYEYERPYVHDVADAEHMAASLWFESAVRTDGSSSAAAGSRPVGSPGTPHERLHADRRRTAV